MTLRQFREWWNRIHNGVSIYVIDHQLDDCGVTTYGDKGNRTESPGCDPSYTVKTGEYLRMELPPKILLWDGQHSFVEVTGEIKERVSKVSLTVTVPTEAKVVKESFCG